MNRNRGHTDELERSELEAGLHPTLEQGSDLESVIERAATRLETDELDQAAQTAVDGSERAADRELGHWVVALVLGAVLAAAAVADWRVALAALLLGLVYVLPVLLAATSTAKRETARETFNRALVSHDDRVARSRTATELAARQAALERAAGLEGHTEHDPHASGTQPLLGR